MLRLVVKLRRRDRIAKQFALQHRHRIFLDGRIVIFILLSCQQHANLEEMKFRHDHRIFLDGVVLSFVLKKCQRAGIQKEFAIHHHRRIFSDAMMLT